MLPAQLELMNIVITLICHLEQKPVDLPTDGFRYIMDCVEHSSQDITPVKSSKSDPTQNEIPNHKDSDIKLDPSNNDSHKSGARELLELDKKLDAESSTNKRLDANDSVLKITDDPDLGRGGQSKTGINEINETLNDVAEQFNNRNINDKNNTVTDAQAGIIDVDGTEVAAIDDEDIVTTSETSLVATETEKALNDDIQEDETTTLNGLLEGEFTDTLHENNQELENKETLSSETSQSTASAHPSIVVEVTPSSLTAEPSAMDKTKTAQTELQPFVSRPHSTTGSSWNQVSPNRQPVLASQFAEKLESSSPNEVDYICLNGTCEAHNTMDPLARLMLLQRLRSVEVVRIRNINLEPPYDVGLVECELESFAFNASSGWIGSLDGTDKFFACSVRTRWKQFEYDWKYLFSLVFIGAGGVGNILVCLAVCLDKSLQNVTNYFLLSLALADLLVSVLVMPLGAIPGFFGYWPLSVPWCNVYLSADVLACSSSIMHMCCISLGRYLGIRNPLKTRHTYSTKKLVGIKIAIVWCLSLSVGGSITLLGLYNRSNIMQAGRHCAINNRPFFLFGSLVAFYVPMLIMVVSYALTVRLLRQKARFLDSAELRGAGGAGGGGDSSGAPPLLAAPTFRTLGGKSHKPRSNQPTNLKVDQQTQTPQVIDKFRFPPILVNFSLFSHLKEAKQRRRQRRMRPAAINSVRTEQKASKVLGLVFFTFVLCWAPFFLLQILQALCPVGYCTIPEHLAILCLWLGYFSSILNPIIYTIFNRTFRAAFIRLLKCQCGQVTKPIRYRSVNDRTVSAGGPPASVPLTLATGVATAAGRSLSVAAAELNPNYPTSSSSKI